MPATLLVPESFRGGERQLRKPVSFMGEERATLSHEWEDQVQTSWHASPGPFVGEEAGFSHG